MTCQTNSVTENYWIHLRAVRWLVMPDWWIGLTCVNALCEAVSLTFIQFCISSLSSGNLVSPFFVFNMYKSMLLSALYAFKCMTTNKDNKQF